RADPRHDLFFMRLETGLAVLLLSCPGPRCLRRGSRLGRLPALLRHEAGAERALGGELVVAAAAEAEVVYGCFTPAGELGDVVVLQAAPTLAASAGLAHICALAAVSLPDGALHVRRDVP